MIFGHLSANLFGHSISLTLDVCIELNRLISHLAKDSSIVETALPLCFIRKATLHCRLWCLQGKCMTER